MLISEFLDNITNKALEDLLKAKGIDTNNSPDFIIEKPKNSDFGDFVTSLPLQLSKLMAVSGCRQLTGLIKYLV